MSMARRCRVAQDGDTVHCYLAGTLPPGEIESFEIHLLECAHCQAAVREGTEIRAASAAFRHLRPFHWSSFVLVTAGS